MGNSFRPVRTFLARTASKKPGKNPPKDWGPTPAMWHIQLWRPEDRSKKPSTRRKCGKSTQRSSFRWYLSLNSMEEWGIRVKGEELKSYGEKLSVRIPGTGKNDLGAGGEEFNINSPKQLGVILFEKMGIPGGKKTKTGYSTAADILRNLHRNMKSSKITLEYRSLRNSNPLMQTD